jgi:hypothetical protein
MYVVGKTILSCNYLSKVFAIPIIPSIKIIKRFDRKQNGHIKSVEVLA